MLSPQFARRLAAFALEVGYVEQARALEQPVTQSPPAPGDLDALRLFDPSSLPV